MSEYTANIAWGQALRRAYPRQEGRFRPSGIAGCIKQQVASAAHVPPTDDSPIYTMAQELGRMGQDIALKAMGHLGFQLEHWLVEETDFEGKPYLKQVTDVPVRGVLPGEADGKGYLSKGNLWRLPEGDTLAEIKFRGTYAYCHVWQGDDLMEIDNGRVGLQATVYMGILKLKRTLIGLFPWEPAGIRTEKRFSKKVDPALPEYGRWFTFEFNPHIYQVAMERLAYGRTYVERPEEVPPEYDPLAGKFPCTLCDWQRWCLKSGRGNMALPNVTPVPSMGIPLTEVYLP